MTKKNCFLICPIGSEGSQERKRADYLLKFVINKTLTELDYTVNRADQIAKPGMITTQIIENLIKADLVIADLHGFNPNVFYELGIRHAISKPVIQLYHPDHRIPFDVAGLRSIKLDITDLESVDNCVQELYRQIKAVEDSPDEITSPFSITIDLQTLKEGNTSTEKYLLGIMESIDNLRSEMISRVTPNSMKFKSMKTLVDEYNELLFRKTSVKDLYEDTFTDLAKLTVKPSISKEEKERISFLSEKIESIGNEMKILDSKISVLKEELEG